MKIHYETMTQAITRVINDADSQLRHIHHIELTPSEWEALKSENEAVSLYDYTTFAHYFLGVQLKVKR